MSLADAIQDLFTDVRDVAQIIAPIAAVIGFLGLGLMYMGSSWPASADLSPARFAAAGDRGILTAQPDHWPVVARQECLTIEVQPCAIPAGYSF